MPTIIMRLSQEAYDSLTESEMNRLGDELREVFSGHTGEEIGALTAYWYPFPFAQNPSDLEAEVYWRPEGKSDVIAKIGGGMIKCLMECSCTWNMKELGVWFLLVDKQPYFRHSRADQTPDPA